MAYIYPREAPKWVQATSVQAATPDGSYVDVQMDFGGLDGQEFKMCRVGWHDPFLNKDKSDVDIETITYGWLRVWFNTADIKPYVNVNH